MTVQSNFFFALKSDVILWLLRSSTQHYAIFSQKCDRNWNGWKRDAFSGSDLSWVCFWSMWRLNHLRNGPVWHSNQFWRFEFCNSGIENKSPPKLADGLYEDQRPIEIDFYYYPSFHLNNFYWKQDF